YSAEYYAGRGADRLVDYLFELEYPRRSIRQYEWRGILKVIKSLVVLKPSTQWLDLGCGNGGLVRYVGEYEACRIVGFEGGWIRAKAAALGIPLVDQESLDRSTGTFHVVTAIEVLEHVEDPLAMLAEIRRMLRPGGVFFCTTGNAQPFRERLLG